MIAEEVAQTVWPLLASGEIKPEVYRVYPLEEAAQAHQLMENSDHIGKIILESQH
ncbi:MAG: hypothetical protein CMF37_08925 [Leeuwenhoekiella sp.]|nr:hypothetical protein [Leeuwenhoekiella sp.]